MEERQPSSDDLRPLPLPPALQTYHVQIPRDQIHRVPPPEHARIIEHHLNKNSKKPSTTSRKTLLWAAAAPILLIAAALIALVSVRATLYNPAPPEFVVSHIQANNLGHRRPEFNLMFRARSPNTRFSVSYTAGPEEVSLVYKDEVIGQGRIRSRIEGGPGGGSVEFPVVLAGNGEELSPEIKKKLGSETEKAMEVTMEVEAEFGSWLRNEHKSIIVSCDFRVKNLLTNNSKISLQECTTVTN